ncbi:MAG: nucleotidyltransferase domain-containing protein [bacterium]
MSHENEIIFACKNTLKKHYGSKLKGVVLYGSLARNQANEESDIDLLVLLKKPFDFFDELYQIIDILYPIQLESDRLISAKPAAEDDFKNGRIQLYRVAKKEGLLV